MNREEKDILKDRFEGTTDKGYPTGMILFENEIGHDDDYDDVHPAVIRVSDLSEVEKIDRERWENA